MNFEIQPYQTEEEILIKRATKGDLEAFNELVLLHQELAYNYAFSLLNDPATSEDAVQESFIKAFRKTSQFRGGSFRAWLLKIVKNTSYDLMRQNRRHIIYALHPENEHGEEMESPNWIVDPSPSVQATIEQRELSNNLSRMLLELPENYRSVITLVDVHDLDYNETAATLGIPVGTVKSRLARARFQMKTKLQNGLARQKSLEQARKNAWASVKTLS